MTNQEFSNQFDLLYNNIMSNQAPGIDEYEKSVFLTKAQDEVLKAYFNPKGNKFIEGFDDSAKRQIDFSNIMKISNSTGSDSPASFGTAEFDPHTNSKSVTLPNDILVIVNESLTVKRGTSYITLRVLPINYQEYDRLTSKPFKRPLNYQAWRLINSSTTSNNTTTRKCDLVIGPADTIDNTSSSKYSIRYVRKPSPIILVNLSSEGLSINGVSTETSCELDEILHQEILQRAVELAKAAYTGDLNSQITLGQTSETNMGIVAQNK